MQDLAVEESDDYAKYGGTLKIALTEAFIEDYSSLQRSLQRKCREMLSSFNKVGEKGIRDQVLPGWRLHKLQSSSFVSLSLDMNYRVLVKVEGETVYVHRAVKHDKADEPNINRNDAAGAPFELRTITLTPRDVADALRAFGLRSELIKPFETVVTEDELIDVLSSVTPEVAELALALYETSQTVIPRSKCIILHEDCDLETALTKSQKQWDVYLHPSQEYIVKLPMEYRLAVSGSAGTGKTVCAWHRLRWLAEQGVKTGFVCANKSILMVSQAILKDLLAGTPADCHFLVPNNSDDLMQLAAEVDHLVIDEGQEFSPEWYRSLGTSISVRNTGVTLFYDLNQLGGNIPTAAKLLYAERLESWVRMLHCLPQFNRMDLCINYRNSKEIAHFYTTLLSSALPRVVKSDIPVFSTGEVITYSARSASEVQVFVANTIRALKRDFAENDVGIICLAKSISPFSLSSFLGSVGISATTDLADKSSILVTTPAIVRGHEKKAMIVCVPVLDRTKMHWGTAINAYIALSRARDRLVVIETVGG